MGVKCGGHCRGGRWMKVMGMVIVGVIVLTAMLKDDIFNTNNSDTVDVVGTGRVPVEADAALVNLGVLTISAPTPEEAISQTSAKLAKVNAVLDGLNIPAENRQVTGYVLNPRYSDPSAMMVSDAAQQAANANVAPMIIGYTCSQQVTVRIPGIKDDKGIIDRVIVAAAKEGVNQVGEVRMIATNVEALKEKAREAALADARGKADTMAKIGGVKLGKISGWNENVVTAPGQSYKQTNYSVDTSSMQTAAPNGVVVLEPGQLDVVIELTVTYNVK